MSEEKDYTVTDSTAIATRAKLKNYSNAPPEQMYSEFALTKGAVGALIGHLNTVLGDDDARYLVCGWLFDDRHEPLRSKQLDDMHWYALYKWVEFWKNDDDGKWYPREGFTNEALAVYSAAIRKVYHQGTEAQQAAGRDPYSLVDNAVGEMGGRVTGMVKIGEGEPVVTPTAIPKSLRHTQYGKMKLKELSENERRLLDELGYDAEDDPYVVNF